MPLTPTPARVAVNLLGLTSLALVAQSTTASYAVRTVTAVLAIVLLCRPGPQDDRPHRLSRLLLASALGLGVLSGVAASVHLVATGAPSPPGGLSDWLYLAYGPVAAAGLLALPRDEQGGPWRLKALADALVAFSGLSFALVGLLAEMTRSSSASASGQAAALGYPLGATLLLSVLLAVLPHARVALQPFLVTAGAGAALLALSDVGYSVGALHGWYTPTTWPALAEQGGITLLALAAVARLRHRTAVLVPRVRRQLQVSAPYVAVLPAISLGLLRVAQGRGLSAAQVPFGVVLLVALVGRQLLANAEQSRALAALRAREQDAHAAARRDPLTGLGNRTALLEGLQALLSQSDGRAVALALLDLDDFKDVNDTHGHDTGDAVLRQVARRLTASAPAGAVVARLGGDEFAVCLRTADRAQVLGEALAEALAEPVVVGQRHFEVTASVGVVLADAGAAATPGVALAHVDVAMYQAKAAKVPHRSALVVLVGQDRTRAAERVRMREEVSRPQLEQFRLVYEPLVDLNDGRIIGGEALLRWEHPVLGLVGPNDFVGLAEQVGTIGRIGEFALRTALSDLAGWVAEAESRGEPLVRGSVGVNLSPRQLADPTLPELVRDALADHGLAPYRLVLEITEQALMDDWGTAIETVRALRQAGVGVAVDDFGTGYSSLRYLRRFDTSTVKVDREFVQALADEPRTRALVASVLEMARSLELYTVAEGVETLDQLEVLRRLGCQYAQGYLFDRPLSPDAFGALLLDRHRYPLGAPASPLHHPLPEEAPAVRESGLPVVPGPRRIVS